MSTDDRRALAEKVCAGVLSDAVFASFKKQVADGIEAGVRRMDADEAAALDGAIDACRALHLEVLTAAVAEVFTVEELVLSPEDFMRAVRERMTQLRVAIDSRMPAVQEVFGRELNKRMEAIEI